MNLYNAEASDIKREIYGEPDNDRMSDAQANAETREHIAHLRAGGATDVYWMTREEQIAALEKLLPSEKMN